MRGFRFYIVKYKEEKKWVFSSFLSESSPLNALFSFCKLIMLSKHKELNPFSKLRLHYIFAGKPLFWPFRLPLFFLCAISLCWTNTQGSHFFAQNRGCIVYLQWKKTGTEMFAGLYVMEKIHYSKCFSSCKTTRVEQKQNPSALKQILCFVWTEISTTTWPQFDAIKSLRGLFLVSHNFAGGSDL